MSAPTLFPPFRAEHLGSLKRPQELLTRRAEFDASKCSKEELEKLEDEAIATIVQMQRDAGIKAITDGEFRRCATSKSLKLIVFGGDAYTQAYVL